jgi:hypothetical protein
VVTPEAFSSEFRKVISAEQNALDALLGRASEYTKHVLKAVLQPVASALGYSCEYEYGLWRLDGAFFPKDEPRGDYFHVAIEHENVGKLAVQEILKLSLLNVPLKVLITYAYHEPESLRRYLTNLSERIALMDYFGDFADKKRQLLILGRRNPHALLGMQSPVHLTEPAWTVYVWDGRQFASLP